jgi:flagellar motor switch protein FliN/FliY
VTTAAPEIAAEVVAAVAAAAEAAAQVLPSSSPLTAGEPVSGAAGLAALQLPAGAVAVTGRLGGDVRGTVVAVVGSDLVEALQSSPLGALETAPAVAPALEAAARALGSGSVDAPRQVAPEVALDGLPDVGAVVAVPLLADGVVRAVLAAALVAGPAGSGPAVSAAARHAGLEMLRDVEMEVTAELGRTRMTVRELLSLSPGAVVELDRLAGSPSDLLVNGTLIARGEVVVVDEEFGLRITEIVVPSDEGELRA